MEVSGNRTLYDLNKDLNLNEPTLTLDELKTRIRQMAIPFFVSSNDTYFMLLCREQNDYTIFNFVKGKSDVALQRGLEGIYTCLTNRGQTISIDLTEAKDALEIWIKIENETYCYYLFPYNLGVIEL